MAVTQNLYTGDGSTVLFSFTFPYINSSDVKVSLNGTDTTAYSLANATTVEMDAAPTLGQAVRVYRDTDDSALAATFYPGSAIRAADLNDNLEQVLFISQEVRTQSESTDASAIAETAQDALDTANAATATAAVALNTANAAETTADGIASTANTALSNSSAAVATANGIAATANTALSNSTAAVNAAAAAVPLAGGTMTGNLTVPSLNGGPLAGFRNRIINGNFDIWQSGTSFTGDEYGADQWLHGRVGTTHTVTRQAFALGQTGVPGEPEYFCRSVVTSVAGAGNFSMLRQRIEGVRTFADQQVTISFWAKADGAKPIAVDLLQYFGTGGSPSADVIAIGVAKTTLSTSWQKVTVTATIPSISGKTIGSNRTDYLMLNIWFDAGSSFNSRTDSLGQQSGTFDIAQVQIEPGPVATPFERRGFGQELALCQRYYETGQGLFAGHMTVSTGTHYYIPFAVTKLAAPSVGYGVITASNVSTFDARNPSISGLLWYCITDGAGSFTWNGTWTASARL